MGTWAFRVSLAHRTSAAECWKWGRLRPPWYLGQGVLQPSGTWIQGQRTGAREARRASAGLSPNGVGTCPGAGPARAVGGGPRRAVSGLGDRLTMDGEPGWQRHGHAKRCHVPGLHAPCDGFSPVRHDHTVRGLVRGGQSALLGGRQFRTCDFGTATNHIPLALERPNSSKRLLSASWRSRPLTSPAVGDPSESTSLCHRQNTTSPRDGLKFRIDVFSGL